MKMKMFEKGVYPTKKITFLKKSLTANQKI